MGRSLAADMSVDGPRVQRAAALLLAARDTRAPLPALAEDARPRSAVEAYAVQDLVVERMGVIGGWKVGAKSPAAEPTCAPLWRGWITRSPASFPRGALRLNGIEAELAFTLAHDLPPRGAAYAIDDVARAIASVHPAVEVVDSRFTDIGDVDPLSLLADSLSHGALVVGDGIALPEGFDASAQTVALDVDGARLCESRGSNPAGDPLRLLAWLADHTAGRCGGLRRGDVVTTGSWTGMRFVPAGTRVAVCFPGIGGVQVDV
jgi:2-keto-4-pentenoate hydratase